MSDVMFDVMFGLMWCVQHKTEEEVEKRKRHIVKLEASIKKMSEELLKGNEIIKKLQNDIRNYHAKVRGLSSPSLLVLNTVSLCQNKIHRLQCQDD